MRLVRALACAVFCLLATDAHATWTLIQAAKSGTCTVTSSSCLVTVTSTTAGDVIVVLMAIVINDPITTITDNGTGGTAYTVPSACASFEPTAPYSISCGYTLNSSGGATSVTINRATTTSAAWSVKAIEFHSTLTTLAYDTAGGTFTSTVTASPVGPALTLSGTNDLVIQGLRGNTPTALTGYTLGSGTNNLGLGYGMNVSSAPAPTWTQTAARAAMNAIAIKEPGGAAVVQPVVDIITRNYFPKGAFQ